MAVRFFVRISLSTATRFSGRASYVPRGEYELKGDKVSATSELAFRIASSRINSKTDTTELVADCWLV